MTTTRFAQVLLDGAPRFIRLDGDHATPLTAPPWASPDDDGEGMALLGLPLLPPTRPSKIVAVGLNYRKHAEEMKKPIPEQPLLFLKPPTALNPAGRPILLPPESEEVHHEAELGLVIGRPLSRASEAEAAAGIFAVCCVNDVTARDIQRREVQYTRAKGFDTFACAGPWMVAGLDWSDLWIRCRLNGQVRQNGSTSDMIFPPAKLVSFISHAMSLLPGDLISTGTPSGVGKLVDGDLVEVEIEGIGTLANPVQKLER